MKRTVRVRIPNYSHEFSADMGVRNVLTFWTDTTLHNILGSQATITWDDGEPEQIKFLLSSVHGTVDIIDKLNEVIEHLNTIRRV